MRFQPDRTGPAYPAQTPATHYYRNWYVKTAGFPNISIFIGSHQRRAPSIGMRAPARTRIGSKSSPPAPGQGMSLVGARRQELPMQSGSGHRDLDIAASERVMNMRGRFFGPINAWFKRQDAAAMSGQQRPRPARGFPIWAFLAIGPRAGRNSRKFSSARSRTRRICRLRSA
jgi:hypothetical protein